MLFPGDSWPSGLTVFIFWHRFLWANFMGKCSRFRNLPSGDKAAVNFLNLCNSAHSLQQVHLCYVGGQTTPLQLHLAIICSSRPDVINWAIELTMNFYIFIRHLYPAGRFPNSATNTNASTLCAILWKHPTNASYHKTTNAEFIIVYILFDISVW